MLRALVAAVGLVAMAVCGALATLTTAVEVDRRVDGR